ncbi:MAG: response regulator [Verrucomicrobia bacterium]|nr:response regulator [Verrucomicrobiota bacterium]
MTDPNPDRLSVQKPKILVVEDELVVALDIQTRLLRMGYEIVGRCSTGEDAVPLAINTKPDLVLMDILLAGKLNGIAAARQIRSKIDLPVVFLTAYSDDATLRLARLAEPVAYLVKPFDERTLKATIEITLYRHRTVGSQPPVR